MTRTSTMAYRAGVVVMLTTLTIREYGGQVPKEFVGGAALLAIFGVAVGGLGRLAALHQGGDAS